MVVNAMAKNEGWKGQFAILKRWLEKKVTFEQRFEAEKGVSHVENGGSVSRQRVRTTKAQVGSMPGWFNDSNSKQVSG